MHEVGDVIFSISNTVVHPAIVCRHKDQLQQVDMLEDGASIGNIQQRPNMTTFRYKNRKLAQTAAKYAVAWADETGWYTSGTNGAALTPYASKDSAGRYYGWQAHRFSGETAPFEHDALYRAFKWAGQLEGPLSANKGFTCDIFVCACFHAAAISLLYSGDLARIQAKAKALGAGRSAQKAKRSDRHNLDNETPKSKTAYENSVLRAWSNVGALGKQDPAFLGHWRSTLSDASPLPEALEDVFTSALLVDGKYAYGAQMMARLEADDKWWQKA
ncbi:MAG: hypothetical protein ACR2P3_00625 [Geminicoccaceae bacterium]